VNRGQAERLGGFILKLAGWSLLAGILVGSCLMGTAIGVLGLFR
jgi:hypothetical protein